jgi:hypothetical protein
MAAVLTDQGFTLPDETHWVTSHDASRALGLSWTQSEEQLRRRGFTNIRVVQLAPRRKLCWVPREDFDRMLADFDRQRALGRERHFKYGADKPAKKAHAFIEATAAEFFRAAGEEAARSAGFPPGDDLRAAISDIHDRLERIERALTALTEMWK